MILFTAAVNGVFALLVAGALIFTRNGVTNEFLLNLLFYIIITPIITVTLTRIMYMSENEMIVDDAMKRIDSVLNAEPLCETENPKHPDNASVSIDNVSYSYDGENLALNHVFADIKSGQTVAFVGPSGGGKSTLANIISRFFDAQSGKILIGAVCAYYSINAVWKFFNNIHTLSRFQCLHNLVFCCVWFTHFNIFKYRCFNKPAVLEHKGYCIHQFVFGNISDINSADENFSALCIKKS